MAQLMRQDGGQLIAVGYQPDQPEMHAHVAARQGKRVDAAVAYQHQHPGKALLHVRWQLTPQPGGRLQRRPDRLHVVGQQGVVDVVSVTVDFARNPVAQSALDSQAHLTAIA